jgi:hypothetical protein
MDSHERGTWVCAGERYVKTSGASKLVTAWYPIEGSVIGERELRFELQSLRGRVGMVHEFEWTQDATGVVTVHGGKGRGLRWCGDAQRCAEWAAAEIAAQAKARSDRDEARDREHNGWAELIALLRRGQQPTQ